MDLFDTEPTKIPSGVNCAKCGKFVGQDGEVYYELEDRYSSQYIIGGKCGKCLKEVANGTNQNVISTT